VTTLEAVRGAPGFDDARSIGGSTHDGATNAPDRTTRAPTTRGSTLGDDLELARLEVRARQLERVLAILKRRLQARDAARAERSGLDRAIRDFDLELERVRARLCARGADAAFARLGVTPAPAPARDGHAPRRSAPDER
jgi:hypothetical protein